MAEPLPELSVLHVHGKDAHSFLNSLVTANLRSLATESVQLAAWCTAQGRVDFMLRLMRTADGYWLAVRSDAATRLAQRLGMFRLRSDVAIDLPEATGGRLQDDTAPTAGEALSDWYTDAVAGRRLRVVRSEEPESEAAQAAFDYADLAAGVPVYGEALAGTQLPLALNLEAFGAVAYDKGCYPGQEVIARMHYRGELKKGLTLLAAAADAAVPPGATIYAAGTSEPALGQALFALPLAGGADHGAMTLVQAVLGDEAPEVLVTSDGIALKRLPPA